MTEMTNTTDGANRTDATKGTAVAPAALRVGDWVIYYERPWQSRLRAVRAQVTWVSGRPPIEDDTLPMIAVTYGQTISRKIGGRMEKGTRDVYRKYVRPVPPKRHATANSYRLLPDDEAAMMNPR